MPNMKPDILSVVNKLTGAETEYGKAIRCPFHDERTPSLHIYDDGHWYCFGCNKFGDVYDFAGYFRYKDAWNAKDPNMFIDVVRFLENAECKTVKYDKYIEKDTGTELDRESAAVLRWICFTYHQALFSKKDPDAVSAKEYLNKRGYSDEIIKSLKIGYSGKNLLRKKSYSLSKDQRTDFFDKMRKLGLMKDDHEYYYNRIMFPNVTKEGEVINLTGRAVVNSKRRYLNIPKLKKDLYLIGMINPAYPVYLTESVTDTVTMWQLGFQTVATNGTALSKRMIASLDPFEDIRIVPQNDLPSINAAEKWCRLVPRCKIVLPNYVRDTQKDINDILKQEGGARALAKINRAAGKPMSFDEYAEIAVENLKK